MREQFTNQATSTLSNSVTANATTLDVASAGSFPAFPQFRILVDAELMLVTSVSASTFTVVRGVEDTTPAVHASGATVAHIITAGALTWLTTGLRYAIDFVIDCGADPTGAESSSSALVKAGALLMELGANPKVARNAVELFIPPGIYKIDGAGGGLWNFAGLTTSCTIRGMGDASIFQLDGCSLLWNIANCPKIVIENFAIVGTNDDVVTPDAFYAFETNCGGGETIIRGVRVLYCLFYGVGFYLVGSSHVEHCEFAYSSCKSLTGAFIYGDGTSGLNRLTVEHCHFNDIGSLNGFEFAVSKSSVHTTDIRVAGSSGSASGAQIHGIDIRNCYFDEGAQNHVWIEGTSGAPINDIVIEHNYFNVPILPGASPGSLRLKHCRTVSVCGMVGTHATGNVGVPLVQAVCTDSITLRSINYDPTSLANFVTIDSACQYLRIEDSPNLPVASIFDGTAARSLAKTTELRCFGCHTEVECYVGLTDTVGSDAGNVMKLGTSPNTYVPILATDGVGFAVGVALDSVVGSGSVRLARAGQIVTAVSDGSTDISIGDPITTIGAAGAGQVRKAAATGTTPIVGTAASAAASGSPRLFKLFFANGMA